jgi:cysteine-rich repeat protein
MARLGLLVGALALAGCLDEGAVVTTDEPDGSSSSTGAASTTGEATTTTGDDVPTTSMPPLMTTDISTTGATGEDSGASTGPAPVCGDGVVDGDEQCDDGDGDDADECPASCAHAFCGDGYLRADLEVCDDGNKFNDDACTNSCTLPTCGDGVTQASEACDDGNAVDGDWCTTACELARCGDGVLHLDHEACDDANDVDTDACRGDCTLASCGDGAVHAGVEACDDGNLDATDACTSLCVPAVCGDGFVRAGVEACDDGDDDDTDACTTDCEAATCGDGVVYAGVEQCDDMNAVHTDACSNKCVITPTGVGLTPGAATPQFGGLLAGTAYDDACAAGEALTGFAGTLSNQSHGRIGGLCSLTDVAVQGGQFVVTTTGKNLLPVRGDSGFNDWVRDCDADEIAVGFSGRADTDVDQLRFRCAPLVVSEAPDGLFSLAVGPPENLSPIGGTDGEAFAAVDCPSGQVATVQRVRAGVGVDAFGLGCSVVALTYD